MIWMDNRRLGFTSPDGITNDFNTVNILPIPYSGSPAACTQRPACLDATPPCSGIAVPNGGWCAASITPRIDGGPVAQEPPPLGTIMPNGLPYAGGPVSNYARTIVVTPTSGAIPPPTVPPIPAPAANALTTFLTGSLFAGIPNWIFLAAGAVLFMEKGSSR